MSYTVVTALDGSLLAERTLRPALDLARLYQGKIVLVRVLPTIASSAPDKDFITHQPDQDEGEVVDDYLRSLAGELEGEGATVETVRREGYVVQELCDVVEQSQADLLIMTSHGRSGFERLLLGSVTEEMVRRCEKPLLVLRSQPVRISEFKRILVPLDGSKRAEEALTHACQLATSNSAVVVLCRIPTTSDLPESHPARRGEEKNIELYLKKTAAGLPSNLRRQTLTCQGSGARAILHLAQHNNIDLVVMATHQRRGLARLFWGSVAENVVRGSVCPVMLIPASSADES